MVNIKRPSIIFSADWAALFEGGIIWLFTLLCLGNNMDNVSRVPSSSDALLPGKHWELAGGSVLYNDTLNEVEIDVICGVYKIATGE